MAETLYADSGGTGVSTPSAAYDAPDGTFTTDTGNTNWTATFGLDNVVGSIEANQTVTIAVRARKESTGGGTPSITSIALLDNGSTLGTDSTGWSVDATGTGTDYNASIAVTGIANNGANLQVQIVTTGAGGAPANRRSVQVDAIAVTVQNAAPPALSGTGSISQAQALSSAGTKAGSGSGSISQAHTLSSTGQVPGQDLSGTGSISQASTLSVTGSKGASGTAAAGSLGYYDFDDTSDALVSTPDHASFPTGSTDLDVVVYAYLDSNGGATYDNLVSTGDPGSADGGWVLRRAPNNTNLQFSWRNPSGTIWTRSSDSALTVSGGRWYRVVLDTDVDGTNFGVTFYYSDDPVTTDPRSVSWTQHGTQGTGADTTGTNDGIRDLSIGNRADPTPPNEALDGRIYKMQLRSGIGGTVVANADFTADAQDGGAEESWSRLGGVTYATTHYDLDGTTNAYVSTPDHASLPSGTDIIDLRVYVSLDDYTGGTSGYESLVAHGPAFASTNARWALMKYWDGSNVRGYFRWIDTTGPTAYESWTSAGSNLLRTDGAGRWVRVVFNPADSNNGGNYTLRWYYSDDAATTDPESVSWTQHGTTTNGGAAHSVYNYSTALSLGKHPDSSLYPLDGKVYKAQIRSDDVVVANPDFTIDDESTGDSTGKVWTAGSGATYQRTRYDFDGTSTAYMFTPDASDVDITGDIDIRWAGRIDSTGVWAGLANKGIPNLSSGEWILARTAANSTVLRFGWRQDGSNAFTQDSDTGLATVGSDRWYRVTMDVDNGSSQRVVTFYYSTDPMDTDPGSVSWSTHSIHTVSGTTSIQAEANNVRLGSNQESDLFDGRIYQFQLRSGINGTVVAALDASQADSTGNVWQPDLGATYVSPSSGLSASASLSSTGTTAIAASGTGSVSQAQTLSSTGVKGGQGTGLVSQVQALASTGAKAGQGTGSITEATSAPTSTGTSARAGTGSVDQAHTITSTGSTSIVASGTGAVSASSALSSTGVRGVSGTGSLSDNQTLASTGQKGGQGTGAVPQASAIASTGTAARSGSGAVSQAHTLSSTGAASGEGSGQGSISQAHTLSSTGTPARAGTGALAQAQALASSGAGGRSGTGSIAQAHTLSSTGAASSEGQGTGSILQASTISSSGSASRSGTGSVSQAHTLSSTGQASSEGQGSGAIAQASTVTSAGSKGGQGTGSLSEAPESLSAAGNKQGQGSGQVGASGALTASGTASETRTGSGTLSASTSWGVSGSKAAGSAIVSETSSTLSSVGSKAATGIGGVGAGTAVISTGRAGRRGIGAFSQAHTLTGAGVVDLKARPFTRRTTRTRGRASTPMDTRSSRWSTTSSDTRET